MTTPLKIYSLISAALTLLYSVLFFPVVTQAPADEGAISSLLILYVVAITSVEVACLQRDDARTVRYYLRWRYSLVSLVTASLPTALWAFAWQHNGWLFLLAEGLLLIVVMSTAGLVNRQRIKGIAKGKLFP